MRSVAPGIIVGAKDFGSGTSQGVLDLLRVPLLSWKPGVLGFFFSLAVGDVDGFTDVVQRIL
jgi:hypothetical protein